MNFTAGTATVHKVMGSWADGTFYPWCSASAKKAQKVTEKAVTSKTCSKH